jgi:hypothetical protein
MRRLEAAVEVVFVFAPNLVFRCIRAYGNDEAGHQVACSGTPKRAFISTKAGDGKYRLSLPFYGYSLLGF